MDLLDTYNILATEGISEENKTLDVPSLRILRGLSLRDSQAHRVRVQIKLSGHMSNGMKEYFHDLLQSHENQLKLNSRVCERGPTFVEHE